jgi:deoxycytidylate deaminase
MQSYMINTAEQLSNKSMARDHKHGAICVIGGKVVSTGFNRPTDPHNFKVDRKGCNL